ncbi:uncharacterized protein LOC135951583 [Calliphora vicina]|uniref:uncharacterized protein LOC135951583 n=1 Tax=Calliphora vicina TaxID=7373 RepID=UPI00325B661D
MTLRTQRNGPLRTANYPTTPHGPTQPMSNKTALSGSGSGSIGQAAKTKMLTSSSNSSAKSAKICVNFNSMLVDGPPDDKKNSRTTPHPTPAYMQCTAGRANDKGGDAEDGISMNSDDNDYLYRPTRLSGAGTTQHRHVADKLILSPSQCKLQPAGFRFFDPKKQVNVINLQLHDNQMKTNGGGDCLMLMMPPQQRRCVKSRTRATQTLFRESSAQTLPYLPGVSNDPEELENLEIFKLPTILTGDGPPGLYEVEVLERARKRWSFAKALKENFRKQLAEAKEQAKLQEHEHILEAFEWEHWIEREEYIQECQMLRLELLIRMFDKREREMHTASNERIQKSCEQIEAKRKAALKKNEIEFNRALRRLEIKHNKQPRVWRKEHITQELGDPGSEFYAPKMRYGVNPSRRHFTASKKGFNMRMDDLEKRAIKMDAKNLKCPFAKLREWSKPKEVLQEVEQNFCSETNLKKLYESLRTLRETSRIQKYTPLCLKAKEPSKTEEKPGQNLQIHLPEEVISKVNTLSSRSSTSAASSILRDSQSSLKESEQEDFMEELRQQKQTERLHMEMLQNEMRNEELETLINSYEGNTIGWLMRFLTEEMSRLKEQRKLHFFTMMAKRERWHREAAEAGLRQKENCMREEYEKLYEECDQTNKEVTDKFLESILDTDIHDYADQKAEQHVVNMARELDKEIAGWLKSFNEVQNPFNYHTLRHALKDIVMPDIEKILYRLERDDCIDYIINDLLFGKVYRALESYDVSFGIANDFVDRIIDNDLYLNSADCSSDCECTEFCCCSRAHQEASAIIRKVIRYAVPGRRWRTAEERVAFENVRDLLDDVFDQVIPRSSIISVDMPKPPEFHDQLAHTDLVCSENDMIIKDNSDEKISLECYDEVKVRRLGSMSGSAVADITKCLKSGEKLLLVDPDKLSDDRSLLHMDEYVKPEPQIQPRKVHITPSTHDIKNIWTFDKTPIFAQTSSEEFLERMQLEEEEVSPEEVIPTPEHKSSSSYEIFEEQSESEEEKEQIEEEEFEEGEQAIVFKESDDINLEPPAVRFIEKPEEKIIEVAPIQEEEDDDDDAEGVMEVLFSYDPTVKYSVPVPSNYDMMTTQETTEYKQNGSSSEEN